MQSNAYYNGINNIYESYQKGHIFLPIINHYIMPMSLISCHQFDIFSLIKMCIEFVTLC